MFLSFFGVFSEPYLWEDQAIEEKKFCLSRSLTAVEKKMQILSASFEVLFQLVINCYV